MATNQGFKNIAINKGGNVDFLYYLLQTKKDCMLELAIGSTFLEISKTALCKIPLQTPMQSNEQSKIADALSDIPLAFFYRGVSNRRYPITSGICRSDERHEENYYFNEIGVRCPEAFRTLSNLEKLTYMQHYPDFL